MDASVNSSELQSDLAGGGSPLVIDVRKSPAFRAASDMIAGALAATLPVFLPGHTNPSPVFRLTLRRMTHGIYDEATLM